MLNTFRLYKPAAGLLKKALDRTGHQKVFDMCSGNGGPIASICEEIGTSHDITFVLSDKFPNLEAYQDTKRQSNCIIDYVQEPVDILEDNTKHEGLRTMFSAIHHFKPDQVQTILAGMIQSGRPLAIFDGGSKSWLTILIILVVHPLAFLLFTPFFRPFRWSRLLFTYVIPLIPLYTIWDGVVSILRLHTPQELLSLAKKADTNNQYDWQHGTKSHLPGLSIAFLIGIPNKYLDKSNRLV